MSADLKQVAQQTASFGGKPLTAAVAFPDAETVTMVFPAAVNLTLNDHRVIRFDVGPQEVPVALKDHWYLKSNKVRAYEPTAAEEKMPSTPQPLPEITERHLAFLQSRGYCEEGTVEDAKRFILNLSPWERQGFFKDCEARTPGQDEEDDAEEIPVAPVIMQEEAPEQDGIRLRTPRRNRRKSA